ncbi:cytochrome P450 [Herbiconiux sp. P15]|uniref:cytochrome P450 n=1 Tax=Herbiconiux liukaitaii TaxID=3342799 RepID=UPI0035B9CF84
MQRAAHPLVYPLLSRLRRPAQRIPRVGVVVTDATVLRDVLLDTTRFTKTGPGASADLWTPILGPSVLLNMEGADHLALRRLLGPLFAPAYVDELTRRTIGASMAALTERLAAGERVDVVAEVRESAGQVISRLVGLERDVMGAELFARVSAVTGFVRLSRPRFTPAQVRQAREVLDDLTRHARTAYRAGDDTVPGRMRALGLSEDEAMGAVGAFVLTGTETLVSYLPRMIAILADTGWLARLAADRTLLQPAIAEGLRVTTPSPVMLRSVAAEARVGGVQVHEGDRLVLATFLANRRAGQPVSRRAGRSVSHGKAGRRAPRPPEDTPPPFDPVGNPAASLKQLWFGAGAHFCLGAPLAMAQIDLVLNAVLDAEARTPLQVTERRAQRGTLIPGYSRLVLAARG